MKKITILFLILCSGYLHAQLIVDNTQTPAWLVQNVLVGQGVTPLNVKFNGSTANAGLVRDQAAEFSTNFNPTNLGISGGLLLTTGKAVFALGPNTSHDDLSTGQMQSGTPNGTDPDLAILSNSTISSSAILEFDFVATGLVLNFDFVFGSEEYAGYVNSINDSFGFFLSGPGVTGPYSGGAKNIALIPSTTTEISINTVNNGPDNNGVCTNCAYYRNNGPIGVNPNTSSGETVEYDGLTTVLRATSPLQCGGTYHIKLAIGNASDNLLDSGVFLKNFRIQPLVLMDNFNLSQNTNVCFGQTVVISSGLVQGTNIFKWYKDGVLLPLETGPTLGNITTGGTYTLTVTTTLGCQIATDDILIGFLPQIPVANPVSMNDCTAPYIFDIDQTTAMLGSLNPADYNITYYDSSLADAENGVFTGTITNLSNYTIPGAPPAPATATIWIRIEDIASGCVEVRPFTVSEVISPTGTISYPSSPYCKGISTPQPITSTVTVGGGTFTATPAGLSLNATTGAVNPSLSAAGTYSVTYTLPATGNCPAFSPPPTNVIIVAVPAAPIVSAPAPYCQNSSTVALSATGSNLLWYTTAVGGTGSSTAPIPSTTAAGSTSYYVSQTAGGCEGPRASIVVQVNPIPAAPGVAPVNFCQNSPSSVLTATGTNLLWYTNATGGTGSVTAPTPSTATAGNTTYYVSQTVSGCESSRAALLVTIYGTPALPTTPSATINYCRGTVPAPLTAIGSNLLWYTVATGGAGNAAAPTPSTAAAGSTTYYVSQTVNGCEGPRTAIVVNINPIPSPPNVTTPLTYCQNFNAPALSATGTGLLWYSTPTGGVPSPTAPTPDTSAAGSITYYVSQASNSCESSRSAIVVNVNAAPSAPGVTAISYCQNQASLALTAVGTNLLWYANATGGTGSATAPNPSTINSGNTTYYVSQSANGCESVRAALVVTVYATPALPTVPNAPINYCQNETGAVPLTATGSNVLWYTTATGGIGATTAPTPSTAIVGSTSYYVSQTINNCEGPRAAIVVNINAIPSAPLAPTPLTYCQNENAPVLTATGSGLLWYSGASGGTGSVTAPTPNTSVPGATTYYVSQVNGGCESPRSAVVVNVNGTPSAPVTVPLSYCQNASSAALTATGSNLLWYSNGTGGIGSATAPTPSTSTAGTVTYYVSQTVSSCESLRSPLSVTVYATPTLPTVPSAPIVYCQNDSGAAPLTATGSNLLWYLAATGGTGNTTTPTPSTATVGSTTYYVSQTINGCEGPRAAIIVNINAIPSAPVAPTPLTYCQNANAPALTATGSGLLWYSAATGGVGNVTAPIPNTSVPGATTYYVTQVNGGCESSRSAVVVNVNATPSAPGAAALIYCQNDSPSALTATGSGLLWYSNATGGTGSAAAPTPSTSVAGTTTYYVTQTINGCEGPREPLAVTVYATPALPAVTTPIGYCKDAIANPLAATGTNLLWYTTATGGTGNSIPPTPSTATSGSTTYYVSQTINNCEGPRASIVVNVTPTPAAPLVTPQVTYCQHAAAIALSAAGSNLLWYTSPLAGGSATAPIPSTTTAGNTSYYVSQTINGCEGPREMILVTILPAPALPGVAPLSYCQNGGAATLTATGTNLLWYNTATGGTGTTIAPTPSTASAGITNYYVSQTVSGCESLRAMLPITVFATPALPVVPSAPIVYCEDFPAVALTAAGSNLLWYNTATGGTGSSLAPTPSTSIAGSTLYYVSQSINGCEGPRAAITVNVSPTPAAPLANTPIVYCQSASNATALIATGTNLRWYTSATGGTGTSIPPTPSTTISGNSVYYVSQTNNGCESPRTAVTVTVLPTPTPPIFPSQTTTYCQNMPSAPLAATGMNLLWYATATGGAGSATAPTPSTAIAGTTAFYVSQTINGCEGPRSTISIVVYPTPALPVISNPTIGYCQNATTAVPLTATGSNLLWYTVATGGAGSATAPTPLTSTAGAASYYVSQTVNGCEGPRATITVNITPSPTAPAVTSTIVYCQRAATNPLNASGANLLWYTSAVGGTGNANAPIPDTSVPGTTNYYVSQSTNGCESARAQIAIIVNPLPVPDVTDGSICLDENNIVTGPYILDSGLDNILYSFEWFEISGTSTTPIANASQSTYPAITGGRFGVRATNNATGCTSDIASANVSVTPSPTKIDVVASQWFAEDQRITVNVFPIGNYEYQLDNGAFQTGNIFVDVPPGSHVVTVKSECRNYPQTVYLMDFPRFFTPNGDGYNDTWNIFSLSGQANAKIYIFDRFGKLLKEISTSGLGWDGTFNQEQLPATDYWFIAHYEDENHIGKIFKSHFALKR